VTSDSTREVVAELAAIGITAFTTTRVAGSFAWRAAEPAGDVWDRWLALTESLSPASDRLVFAHQVHGTTIVEHGTGWRGLLRVPDADGHLSLTTPTAMAVTLADCVPVFIGHPSGSAAVLHSGWKGTAGGITTAALRLLKARGLHPVDLRVHCGPAICGRCYEVSPDVYAWLTGRAVVGPTLVDLRDLILAQASAEGVTHLSSSTSCTRCDNHAFFSHRCGDPGRQLGVIVSRR
jgi:hypothetical protein